MDKTHAIKITLMTAIGTFGSAIANLLGGWDMALKTLIILMAIDYLTGWIVAAVFKKSNKSETGGLESKAGWKGLCRKGVTLLMVLIGAQIDNMLKIDYVRYAVIIGYSANEILSATENAGLMGLPIPKVIINAIEILKKNSEKDGE